MNFNEKVWNLCKQIPRGKVTTYRAIANKLGTKAYRAVGSALNKNPDAPRVPCHRVIRSDGSVGEYAFGTKKKIKLLKQEGIEIISNKINLAIYLGSQPSTAIRYMENSPR